MCTSLSTNVCPCTFDYLFACVWHAAICVHKETSWCVPSQQEALLISSCCSSLLVDWQGKKQVGANEWCHNPLTWQPNPALFLPFFSVWLSRLVQIPVGLFVCLSNTYNRTGQQTLPRNFYWKAASLMVCFTFNDAHIRELGGNLLPLSPQACAPDYSLASDSRWWMA